MPPPPPSPPCTHFPIPTRPPDSRRRYPAWFCRKRRDPRRVTLHGDAIVLTFAVVDGQDGSDRRLRLHSSHTLRNLVISQCQDALGRPLRCRRRTQQRSRVARLFHDGTTRLENMGFMWGCNLKVTYDYRYQIVRRITLLEMKDTGDDDGGDDDDTFISPLVHLPALPLVLPTKPAPAEALVVSPLVPLPALPSFPPPPQIPAQVSFNSPVITSPLASPRPRATSTAKQSSRRRDLMYSRLNDWNLRRGRNRLDADPVSVHLFQAGKLRNYGHMDNGFTSVYLPTRPNDLATWLECLDAAVGIRPAGIDDGGNGRPHYTWQSVVPRSRATLRVREKCKSSKRWGFRDAPVIDPAVVAMRDLLEGAFPRVTALAGTGTTLTSHRVSKGWISFLRSGNGGFRLDVYVGSARKSSTGSKRRVREGWRSRETVSTIRWGSYCFESRAGRTKLQIERSVPRR